ncbi:folate-biopterin transporter-like isoform X2 [Convolutriloba macropyga]|uniref:folate-biopterin transporter-like isoform X2 n=1 Tax=Convolutriloba macropyga TaxID=536237 RepID=UPI003F51FF56
MPQLCPIDDVKYLGCDQDVVYGEKSTLLNRNTTQPQGSSAGSDINNSCNNSDRYQAHELDNSSDETALAGGVVEQINYWSLDHIGLFLQYFCVGICYSCSISVNYEFFTSYMGQSGDFFNVALSAISLPWSFKIVYGAVNDCLPILGYRRKPYMVMGWAGCAIVGLALTLQKLPGSRFEHDELAIASGNCSERGVLKPDSEKEYQNESLKFMSMLTLFNVFLVLTDVAMDGLMVQYARKESLKRRGRAQTFVYAIRAIGMACGACLKGFGLNWYEYSGPWCKGISISVLFAICAVTSLVAIPVILFMTTEDKVSEEKSVKHVVGKMWILLQNTAVQKQHKQLKK